MDDIGTRIDVHIRLKSESEPYPSDSGCSCEDYDKRECTLQNVDYFDM